MVHVITFRTLLFILFYFCSVVFHRDSFASTTTLDSTFGTSGKVEVNLGTDASSRGNSLILLPDGKFLVAGSLTPSGGTQVGVIVRLTSSGSIDTIFGPNGDGTFTADFGTFSEINGLARQSDGKLVAIGGNGPFSASMRVIRLTADGALDTTFAGDGIAEVSKALATVPEAVVIQSDGKIVVAASLGSGNTGLTVFRLLNDGTLDTDFDSDGFASATVTGTDKAQGLAIQSDGKIIVVGTTNADANFFTDPNVKDFAIARFNSDGTLDNSFDSDGMRVIDIETRDDDALTVLIQPADNKIVIAGYAYMTGSRSDCAVIRLNTDGSSDTSFDFDGEATFYMGGLSLCNSLSLQSDGRFIGAGYYAGGLDRQFMVTHILADGNPDTNFNDGGAFAFGQFLPSNRAYSYAHAVQGDGRIVLAGEVDLGTKYAIALALFETVDSAPTITSIYPPAFSTDVSVGTTVTATFSKAMLASTVNSTNFMVTKTVNGVAVDGAVTYDSATKTATFTPSSNLELNFNYTAVITTGVQDSAGNAMASNKLWQFQTEVLALFPSGNNQGGCGIVKNDDKGAGGKSEFLTMMVITLAGIAMVRRFSRRFKTSS